MKSLQVKDAVTSRQLPPCVPPTATLAEAWRARRAAGGSDLVVTTDGTPTGTLVGVLSGQALVDRGLVETPLGDVVLNLDAAVGDLLVHTPEPVTEDADLGRVLAMMRELHLSAVPLAKGGRLAGLVTETDVLQAIARRRQHAPRTEPRGRESPRDRVLEDVELGLANPLWANFMQLLGEAGI